MTDRQILNRNLAQMLKGGVIMDVTNAQEAEIAEAAGAVAVMALERVPSDIRRDGGVARMSDPKLIKEIKSAVSIPVMAKVRIGHIVEAEILEALGIDYIDESEVLTPADDLYHLDKHAFKSPFVCGARNLGEALRRVAEGAPLADYRLLWRVNDLIILHLRDRTISAHDAIFLRWPVSWAHHRRRMHHVLSRQLHLETAC